MGKKTNGDLLTQVRRYVNNVLAAADPDERPAVPQVLVAQTAGGVLAFDLEGVDRDRQLQVIPHYLRKCQATAAVMVAAAWASYYDDDPGFPDVAVRPSQRPNRFEVIDIIYVTKWTATHEHAVLHRHPDAPPTLAGWERSDGDSMTGEYPDAIRAGLGWTSWPNQGR